MKVSILAILFPLSVWCATTNDLGNAVLIDDDGHTRPANSISTPEQVQAIEQTANNAAAVVGSFQSSVDALASKVELYSTNYVVTSTVYVQSVGAVAYDPSNQTVNIQSFTVTDTNVQIVATLRQLPLVPPSIDWRQTMGAGGAWSSVVATVTSTAVPEGVTDAAAAYLFVLPRPAGGSAFWRIVDNSTGAGGSGLYWVVFGGLTVDGHRGSSGIITNVVGTVTNYYRMQGGIIVEPVPLGGF